MKKMIGILLMATLMAICFTATAAPALAGATSTYIKYDIDLAPTATIDPSGQEVSVTASIDKLPGLAIANYNLDPDLIGAKTSEDISSASGTAQASNTYGLRSVDPGFRADPTDT